MLLDDTDCVDGVRLQPLASERELCLLAITTGQSPYELHPESKGRKVMRLIIVALLLDFIGMALGICALMAHSELKSLATAAAPSPEEAALLKIIGPELFDSSLANTKPAEMADGVLKRIYFIGACSIAMITLGPVLIVTSNRRSTGHTDDEKV